MLKLCLLSDYMALCVAIPIVLSVNSSTFSVVVWAKLMLPLLGIKALAPYSVSYLEQILEYVYLLYDDNCAHIYACTIYTVPPKVSVNLNLANYVKSQHLHINRSYLTKYPSLAKHH